MSCPSCGGENRDSARFCSGCGARLVAACSGCGTELAAGARYCDACGRPVHAPPDPRSYTPKHLADHVLHTKAALEGERKQVTVLFADVKGSVDLSEQVDPEEWHVVMERFLALLAEGVHRFEGTINQYTGDGIMALFGAPIAHEDHAQRACFASLALREALRDYADELRLERGLSFAVRIGLNSGEVVVGRIGDDLRMDYTAHGHTVGLAARMEQLAEPGKIFLTGATAKIVEGAFELRDLGESRVKGSQSPVRVYELCGAGQWQSRLEVSRSRGLSALVGRESELGALEQALESAHGGELQIVGVVGEAGVGKSRLCYELLERCRARYIPTAEACGLAHARDVPLLPVLTMLRSTFGVTDQDRDEAVRDKVAGRVLRLAPEVAESVPVVLEYLGVPDLPQSPTRSDPEVRQRELLRVLQAVSRARGRRELTVQLVEDLHWLDPASDAFLERWIEAMSGTRALLLLNFRPGYRALWMEAPGYHEIRLEPLAHEGAAELVRELIGNDASLGELPREIAERTGGNPFFIEEVIRSLRESARLVGERGALRLVEGADAPEIPANVQAVLAARIDRLPEREKELLQSAAVIGRSFPVAVLEAVSGVEQSQLGGAMARLRDAGLVHEESLYPEVEYAFAHPLTREVAYRSQLSTRRKRLHAETARALCELGGDRLDERAALLAHHWEAAGEALEAARWHRRAAERASITDRNQGVHHWRRVRDLIDGTPASREANEHALAACAAILSLGQQTGLSREEADRLFDEGRALCNRLLDLRTHALLIHAVSRRHATDVPSWRELAGEAAALAEQTGDPRLEIYLRIDVAHADMHLGHLRDALDLVERNLGELSADPGLREGPLGPESWWHSSWFRGILLMHSGRFEEAREQFSRLVDSAREQRQTEVLRNSLSGRCELALLAGDTEAAMQDATEAREIAERLGTPFQLAWSDHMLGVAHTLQGDWNNAIDALERSLDAWRVQGTDPHSESYVLADLAMAYLGRGDRENALRLARSAVEQARRVGSRLREARAGLVLSRCLLEANAPEEEIARGLRGARELIESIGARGYAPWLAQTEERFENASSSRRR